MANQYHDELGRFCSKNEMGNAVERLSNLMTAALTQEARDEAASQWFTLKNEYDALVAPDYSKQLADLDARIFSTHSRSELRRLEEQRAGVQLEADASDEGYDALLRNSLSIPRDNPFRFADDQRIQRAAVYRTERETSEAIKAYEAGTAPRYESTIQLFADANVTVSRTSTHVYIAEQGASGYEIHHNFPLDDPDFDQQILTLRQHVGNRLADQAKFGKSKLGMDLYNTDLNAVYFGLTERNAHIVRSGTSEVLAEAEFNENGAFVKATVSHPSGDGAVDTLNTPAQFRSFLQRANKSSVPVLPAWKSGAEEPKRPAYTAPARSAVQDADLLF